MDKLRSLELFLAVIDQGSYAAAAIKTKTSPSTISKAITRLEESLTLQLFQRSTRQIKLTPAGARYAETVRSLINELANSETALQEKNEEASGLLRINTPVAFGRLYLRPLLKEFIKRFPRITLDISYEDKYVDIIDNQIDICIRTGTISDSRLVARQLSPIDSLICASPAYLKKNPPPKSAKEFSQHPWIRFRYAQTNRLMSIMMPSRQGTIEYDPDDSFIVDDGQALAELCADGFGLTQVPHFIARDWLNKKSIVPIFPTYSEKKYGVYMLYPKRNYLPAKVRVFIDYITESMEAAGEFPNRTWARDLKTWRA